MERRKLSEQAFDLIRKLILSGQLMPGEKIPEEKISTSLGISRTPVREALQKLQQLGLVVIVPRSYAKVAELQPDDWKHVGEVRLQLEALTARLLAKFASKEDCDLFLSLAEECIRLIGEKDTAGVFEKHSELHLEMARRTGNRYLYEMMKSIDIKVQLLRVSGYMNEEEIFENLSSHKKIIEAISMHDEEEAERLMVKHISKFYFERREKK